MTSPATAAAPLSSSSSSSLITRADPRQPIEALRWPALRFRLLDELGEPMDIGFRRVSVKDGSVVEAVDVRHEDHDGVGGFTALLEARGFTIPTMPVMADPAEPGWFTKLGLLRRYLGVIRGWRQQWKREPDWSVVVGGPAPAIALLDRATTKALLHKLKASSSGLTAGVVAALDRVAAEALLQPGSPRRWMVPVNMRTSTTKHYGNAVTSLLLPFPSSLSAAEAHAALKDMLARRFHWGTTLVSSWLSRTRHARLRRMLRRFDASKTIFGYVSNVGAWPPAGVVDVDGDDATTWAVIPPVGRRGPLASVLLVYRGRLAVSLHAHGCLRMSDDDVIALLRSAVVALLRDAGVDDGGGSSVVVRGVP